MLNKALLVVVGLAALVLNPFFGCGAKEGFSYGADEMRAAIEGTWKLSLPATEKEPAREITLSISQSAEATQEQHSRRSGPIADAAACAQRSLVRSAGACIDMSEMPLDLKVIAGGPPATAGVFRVAGLRFTTGHLTFGLGTWSLSARVTRTGSIAEVSTNGYVAVGASMVRMATAQR